MKGEYIVAVELKPNLKLVLSVVIVFLSLDDGLA